MSNESTKAIIKRKVKAHIPKDCLKELRIVYRMALETIYGIKRTGWVNLAIIYSTTLIIGKKIFNLGLHALTLTHHCVGIK